MDRFLPTALAGGTVRWLLDLEWAGLTIRLSDAELDVKTEDGEVLHYAGVLDLLDATDALDLLSDGSSTSVSVAVAAVLPVDVPELVAGGHDLSAATGTLSRWIEGTTYEERRVLIAGRVSDPEYGASEEPVSFSLEAEPPYVATELVPALTITGTSFEDDWILTIDSESFSLAYPLVIGSPGKVSTEVSSSGRVSGSQAICVWMDPTSAGGAGWHSVMWLVAGHHCTAKRAYVVSDEFTTAVRVSLFNGRDRQGNDVCYIPWWGITQTASPSPEVYPYEYDSGHSGSYAFTPTDTDGNTTYNAGSYTGPETGAPPDDVIDQLHASGAADNSIAKIFVSWDDDIDGGGGLADGQGNLIRGAGDVMEHLLRLSANEVDWGRFNAVRPLLNRYKLDFVIDAQVTPWSYIQSNLLPILPVSMVHGPGGLYPIVWRHEATAADAVCHLDTSVDVSLERSSNVQFDRNKIVNDFTLKYALSVRTGNYQGSKRLSIEADDDGTIPSLACRLSQLRYRTVSGKPFVSAETLETSCVYDDATALAILNWRAQAYAFARRRVQYAGPETAYGWLERGQVVTITDPDLRWSKQVAIIESVRIDGSPLVRLGLLLVEDPVRDLRPAT